MSKRSGFGLAPILLTLPACVSNGAVSKDVPAANLSGKSAELADRFQADLQGQLLAAMQQGGAAGAIAVCHEVAPAIVHSLSNDSGAHIRRIAFKQRNPSAVAEGDMRQKLEELAASPLGPDGKPASVQWTSGVGKSGRLHYLRAIPMKEQPCAACHGIDVAPDVQARIREVYPDDRATGFRSGELRGAIAISWPVRGR
jgi:hypothetical protein